MKLSTKAAFGAFVLHAGCSGSRNQASSREKNRPGKSLHSTLAGGLYENYQSLQSIIKKLTGPSSGSADLIKRQHDNARLREEQWRQFLNTLHEAQSLAANQCPKETAGICPREDYIAEPTLLNSQPDQADCEDSPALAQLLKIMREYRVDTSLGTEKFKEFESKMTHFPALHRETTKDCKEAAGIQSDGPNIIRFLKRIVELDPDSLLTRYFDYDYDTYYLIKRPPEDEFEWHSKWIDMHARKALNNSYLVDILLERYNKTIVTQKRCREKLPDYKKLNHTLWDKYEKEKNKNTGDNSWSATTKETLIALAGILLLGVGTARIAFSYFREKSEEETFNILRKNYYKLPPDDRTIEDNENCFISHMTYNEIKNAKDDTNIFPVLIDTGYGQKQLVNLYDLCLWIKIDSRNPLSNESLTEDDLLNSLSNHSEAKVFRPVNFELADSPPNLADNV